ncbi:hybrid sensor histidine kinase/response regulator [Falsiroseomonas sp. E2-1-a4]|uniref:hybrid sensor histidine kinase/response regulator n=1 Tax=Falsiroseomonas sp. E2-1-a4 TaxID=3239299 RepID=UPI003F354279
MAFGLLLLVSLQAERRSDRQDDVLRTTTTLVAGLDSEMRAGLRALDALAGSQHLKTGDLGGFRQEAQRLLAREPQWYTIALTDGERQLLNLRYPEGAALPRVEDLAAVGSVLRTGHPAPGGLIQGRVSFRVPVRVDGAVRFALVATQEATTFAQLMDRAGLPAGWSALLLDGDGRLIARAATGRAEPEALRPALAQLPDPVEVSGMLALARPVGDSRWFLVVAAPPSGLAAVAMFWLLAALGATAALASLGLATRIALRDRGQDAQRERRQSEALARAAEQDRRRNELMLAVSQELHAPLTGLLGYCDQLAQADLPAPARLLVERQRQAGQALLALVGDVLDFALLEDGSIALEDADIEIAALLEECAALMRRPAENKGLVLRVAIDPGLPRWIRGDPLRVREVTTKLLDNAIRAAATGQVVLSARLTPRPERVEIAVADAAPAIALSDMSRLFDPTRDQGSEGPSPASSQASSPGAIPGSGLGLAICRRLVEAMGGAIGAERREGQGRRFVFWVPFRPGASPTLTRAGTPLRILVAEDVAASRLLLTTVLERAGHTVTAAADGPAALAALHGANFDLAVLDLHMPSLGGLGVARAMRALPGEKSRLPLIALTADPAEQMEESCRAAGFDAVLRKPFETRRLLGLIDGLRARAAAPIGGAP